jgi:hypothetical protein
MLQLEPVHRFTLTGQARQHARAQARFQARCRQAREQRLQSLLGLRCEWDVREDVTLSAALRALRLDERDRSVDDYSTEMLEIALTYRF